MKVIRTTHIDIKRSQIKQLPFGYEFLNIQLDNNLVKISYIEDQSISDICEVDFRIYQVNEPVDFDGTAYTYCGLIEHNNLDYHVFYKNVRQLADMR